MPNTNIGLVIRSLRKNLKISQGVMAKRINTGSPYLSQIEKGRKDASSSLLLKISKELGVPLEIMYFLSLRDEDIPEENKKEWENHRLYIRSLIVIIFPDTDGL